MNGENAEEWIPKTELGRKVKEGIITDIDEILDKGMVIREPEIVDTLLPNLEVEMILLGQSKGKFGGGKRKVYKQTQKKTAEGNKLKFTAIAVVGNRDGYVGLGKGSAGETVPAKLKAIKNAKLNIIKIKRGCGSWECSCGTPHSIPFRVEGKEGSVKVVLKPAPKGLGLAVSDELKKILSLAGVKDVWGKSFGQTTTRQNLVQACFNALKQLSKAKIRSDFEKFAGIKAGKLEG